MLQACVRMTLYSCHNVKQYQEQTITAQTKRITCQLELLRYQKNKETFGCANIYENDHRSSLLITFLQQHSLFFKSAKLLGKKKLLAFTQDPITPQATTFA